MLRIGQLCKLLILVFILSSLSATASTFKTNAPEFYTVKKGDTLWQIAGLYLDKPWLWPKLWQNNPEIENPHLIYPGDILKLVINGNGQKTLQLVRTEKRQLKLSPKTHKAIKMAEPIPTLPWKLLQSYIRKDLVLQTEEYERLPYILGDQEGAVRFATGDTVLGKAGGTVQQDFRVLRTKQELFDHEGESLGLWVQHISEAEYKPSQLSSEILVEISNAKQEVKPGDRLYQADLKEIPPALRLQPATTEIGRIITSLHDHALLGKYDIAVLDLGADEVEAGTVLGIYMQGPDIVDAEPIEYIESSDSGNIQFIFEEQVQQPALKVGEVVVFKVFGKASFGLIISSVKVIRAGAWVAKP